MKIFHEFTHEELNNPDLSAGYLYDSFVVTGQEVVTMDEQSGLRVLVDVTAPCKVYRPFPAGNENVNDGFVTWAELAAAYNEGVTDSGQ